MSDRSWNRGTPVRIRLEDGTLVGGQVWDEADRPSTVWIALSTGLFARVHTESWRAEIFTADLTRVQAGTVAA